MITKERIAALAEEALKPRQFIVELRIETDNRIYIELDDRDKPVSISDCMAMSRGVEHNLDRDEEDFSIEVTSPGLSNPFKVFEQYLKNVGREVKVKRTDGTVQKGLLKEAYEDYVILEQKEKRRIPGRKAKEWVTEDIDIQMTDIKETFVELVF